MKAIKPYHLKVQMSYSAYELLDSGNTGCELDTNNSGSLKLTFKKGSFTVGCDETNLSIVKRGATLKISAEGEDTLARTIFVAGNGDVTGGKINLD